MKMIVGIFTHAPPSHSKLSPKFLLSQLRQRKVTHPPGSIYLKTAERGGETYDFLY